MKLPQFLDNVPRAAYIVAVPVAAFLFAVAVTLATSGGDDGNDDVALVPTVGPSLDNLDTEPTPRPSPTPRPEPSPEPTQILNRENCSEIQGTDYYSPGEREWYLSNCLGGGQQQAASPGGGGSAGGGGGSSNSGGGGGGSSAPPPSGGASATGNAAYAGEFALGERLIIPSLGIDSPVSGAVVPPNGAMPDPVGYFYAIWYDFQNFGGLGGHVDGNLVLAAHVDCATCHNGGPGQALFWGVRNMAPGDTAQYVTSDGQVINYTVSSAYAVSPNVDWSGIVSSGAADMTLITCTGNFSAGHYDTRYVVALTRS